MKKLTAIVVLVMVFLMFSSGYADTDGYTDTDSFKRFSKAIQQEIKHRDAGKFLFKQTRTLLLSLV